MEFKEILDYIFAPIIGYNIWLHNQIYKNKDDIRDNKEEINANSINDKFWKVLMKIPRIVYSFIFYKPHEILLITSYISSTRCSDYLFPATIDSEKSS